VFSKACQYGIVEEKNCKNLKYISIKSTQVDLQNASFGLRSLGRANMNGNKACLEIGIRPKKLNTPVKTR
jgi:hypothetical protein